MQNRGGRRSHGLLLVSFSRDTRLVWEQGQGTTRSALQGLATNEHLTLQPAELTPAVWPLFVCAHRDPCAISERGTSTGLWDPCLPGAGWGVFSLAGKRTADRLRRCSCAAAGMERGLPGQARTLVSKVTRPSSEGYGGHSSTSVHVLSRMCIHARLPLALTAGVAPSLVPRGFW